MKVWYCDFCGLPNHDDAVEYIVVNEGNGAAICVECALVAVKTVEAKRDAKAEVPQ